MTFTNKDQLFAALFQYAVLSWMSDSDYLTLKPADAWKKWVENELDFDTVSDIAHRVFESGTDGSTETTSAEFINNRICSICKDNPCCCLA